MEKIKFYQKDYTKLKPIEKRNIIILSHSDWDDWFTFETLYSVYYYDFES